jgi:hypothetical protein
VLAVSHCETGACCSAAGRGQPDGCQVGWRGSPLWSVLRLQEAPRVLRKVGSLKRPAGAPSAAICDMSLCHCKSVGTCHEGLAFAGPSRQLPCNQGHHRQGARIPVLSGCRQCHFITKGLRALEGRTCKRPMNRLQGHQEAPGRHQAGQKQPLLCCCPLPPVQGLRA